MALSQLYAGCDMSFLPAGTLGCASVTVHPPIVPLGSAVTASCSIQRELCRGLQQEKIRISWMLDSKLVAGSQYQGPGGTEVSNLTLPRFNHTHARLWCCVEWNGTKQRLSMAEIKAGCKSDATAGHPPPQQGRALAQALSRLFFPRPSCKALQPQLCPEPQ